MMVLAMEMAVIVIDVDYNITIPANSKITIVNFVIMNGKDTADTAADIDAEAGK